MYVHKPIEWYNSRASVPLSAVFNNILLENVRMSPYLRHIVPFLLQSAKDDKKQNNLFFNNPSIMLP